MVLVLVNDNNPEQDGMI